MRCRNRLEDGSERRRKEGETRVRKIGAGKKAQPVKYMSCKHGGCEFNPQDPGPRAGHGGVCL